MLFSNRHSLTVGLVASTTNAIQFRDAAHSTVVRHGRVARLATLLAFGLLIGSASSVQAATASWNPNTEADLAGYVLHWGMTTHDYTSSIDVGNTTNWTLTLTPGQYYFALRAYHTSGTYSDFTTEVPFTVANDGIGTASLITPSGTIATTTPAYTWNAVPASTWYLLWVQDASGVRLNEWYTAAQVGCASSGACAITPATTLAAGAAQAALQTYSDAAGYGAWSDVRFFTVSAPAASGPVTLTAPASSIATRRPTYTWTAASGATWYLLWVEDVNGPKINEWYTAAQVGCAAGTGSCSSTPAINVARGAVQAWVQTYSDAAGYSAWSAPRAFTVTR